MKNVANSITLKSFVSLVLSFTLVSQLQVQVSHASVAGAGNAAELKSESQFRSEASRYDGAIRAIGGIATMKLETTDDLKRAVAILERERPNLKLFFSKLVVLTISDSTFVAGVKKKAPDKRTAESFLQGLRADRTAVLKVDGGEALSTRLRGSAESDAAILRRTGDRLNEAITKIRKISHEIRSPGFTQHDGFKTALFGFTNAERSSPESNTSMQVFELLLFALFVGAVVAAVILYGAFIIRVNDNETGQAVVACMEANDVRYANCAAGGDIFTVAACYAIWLFEDGACLLAR